MEKIKSTVQKTESPVLGLARLGLNDVMERKWKASRTRHWPLVDLIDFSLSRENKKRSRFAG